MFNSQPTHGFPNLPIEFS